MILSNVHLLIFDHNSKVGYHFRQDTEQKIWKKFVQEENEAVRKLSGDELSNRIRIVPLGFNSLAVMASMNFKSDGRNAVRTASIRLDSGEQPIRWKNGLIPLVRKSLQSKSAGGELRVSLEESSIGDIDNDLLTEIGFPDVSVEGIYKAPVAGECVMSWWNTLSPDSRADTEVIIGSIDRDEKKSLRARVIAQESSLGDGRDDLKFQIFPASNNPNLMHNGTTQINAKPPNLEKSILVADSTGLIGTEWQNVIASEMQRRKSAINSNSSFDIRLKLATSDKDSSRKAIWRSLLVDELRGNLSTLYPKFISKIGALTGEELGSFSETDQLEAVTLQVGIQDSSKASILWLDSILGSIPLSAYEAVFNLAPLHKWFFGLDDTIFIDFMTKLLSNYPGFIVTVSRITYKRYLQSDESYLDKNSKFTFGDVIYSIIQKNQLRIPADEYNQENLELLDYILLNKFDSDSYNPKGENYTPLRNSIPRLLSIDWSSKEIMLRAIAKAHCDQNPDFLLHKIGEFREFAIDNPTNRPMHKQDFLKYLKYLEVIFESRGSIPHWRVAYSIIDYVDLNSWWFKQLLTVYFDSSRLKKHLLKGYAISDISDESLLALRNVKPPLKGWPSPFREATNAQKNSVHARLAIKPRFAERMNKIFGRFSILFAVIFNFILVYDLVGSTLSLPFTNTLTTLFSDIMIGGTFVLSLILSNSLTYRFWRNIRKLRN